MNALFIAVLSCQGHWRAHTVHSTATLMIYMKPCLKKGTNFWKCWNSKLRDKNRLVNTVNGVTDKRKIAENFATYFSQVCTNTSAARAAELKG